MVGAERRTGQTGRGWPSYELGCPASPATRIQDQHQGLHRREARSYSGVLFAIQPETRMAYEVDCLPVTRSAYAGTRTLSHEASCRNQRSETVQCQLKTE